MEEEIVKQTDNNKPDRPWLWKKGQSGNLAGRPKGKTLKDYCRDFLTKMTEKERQEFLNGLPKEIIWKMAEGNPSNDLTVGQNPEMPFIIKIEKDERKDNQDVSGAI